MSGTAGKVALVNSTSRADLRLRPALLTASVVDFVGYGATANDFAGGAPTAGC